MRKTEYLIIGNGIAGLSAAMAIREQDKEAEILMVTRQEQTTYARPLLSKAGLKLADFGALQVVDEAWHRKKNIGLLTGTAVEDMDVEHHRVRCGNVEIEYGKCIYALGGDARLLPVKGNRLPGVFVLRTMEDVRAMKRCAFRAKKVAVIGGGVIGMEISEVLYRYGMKVTVLENQPRILPRVLDEETAKNYVLRLQSACEGAEGSIKVRTGVNVAEVLGEERVTGVRLADGEEMRCDMVIFSCGISACADLARRAGIAAERAVVVDECMRTSARDVYACGDCAQYGGNLTALWKPAMEQGRIAGLSACGVCEKYRPGSYPVLCNSSLVSLFAVGDLAVAGEDGYQIEVTDDWEESGEMAEVMPRKQGTYRRLVYREGRLVGAALIGNLAGMHVLEEKIREAGDAYE